MRVTRWKVMAGGLMLAAGGLMAVADGPTPLPVLPAPCVPVAATPAVPPPVLLPAPTVAELPPPPPAAPPVVALKPDAVAALAPHLPAATPAPKVEPTPPPPAFIPPTPVKPETAPKAEPPAPTPFVTSVSSTPAAEPVVPAAAPVPAQPPTDPRPAPPAGKRLKVHLSLGDDRPRFEVRDGDETYLKVTSDRVEVKSPANPADLLVLKADGRVAFVTPGGDGVCDALTIAPGGDEVRATGNVSFRHTWGRAETVVSAGQMTFRLAGTGPTAVQTAGYPPAR